MSSEGRQAGENKWVGGKKMRRRGQRKKCKKWRGREGKLFKIGLRLSKKKGGGGSAGRELFSKNRGIK